ncbi:MAG TPA: hypothetical protein VNF49_03885, partial [Candidatus Binataceae bacterium]|nr:hypothetical protein [Candidatus Binataceae bacterium]
MSDSFISIWLNNMRLPASRQQDETHGCTAPRRRFDCFELRPRHSSGYHRWTEEDGLTNPVDNARLNSLLDRFAARDRLALARLITLVENRAAVVGT